MRAIPLLMFGIALLAMACPSEAVSYSGYRFVTVRPSAAGVDLFGQAASAGAASCDRLAIGSLGYCESQGNGAAIFADLESPQDVDTGTGLEPGINSAIGTCSVTPRFPLPQDSGDYEFVCGADRDDDGLVTNVDLASSDPLDGFDDDFVAGDRDRPSLSVCWARDTEVASASTDRDPQGDFDELVVFIQLNVPKVPIATLEFLVTLEANSTDRCVYPRSGHTHDAYFGSGDPASPAPGPSGDVQATGLLLVG